MKRKYEPGDEFGKALNTLASELIESADNDLNKALRTLIQIIAERINKPEEGPPRIGKMVEAVACMLVKRPEAVKVRVVHGEIDCMIEIQMDSEDIYDFLGRRAIHADALNTLLKAAGHNHGKRYTLVILS